MPTTTKTYRVGVITSFHGEMNDDAEQLLRMMNVRGFSNLRARYKTSYSTGLVFNGFGQTAPCWKAVAVFTGWTSKAQLQQAIKNVLGSTFWQNTNIVELDSNELS